MESFAIPKTRATENPMAHALSSHSRLLSTIGAVANRTGKYQCSQLKRTMNAGAHRRHTSLTKQDKAVGILPYSLDPLRRQLEILTSRDI